MGLAYAPLALIVLREAPTETQGTASSALSLMDTLGTAIGTGVSGAIVAAGLRATGEVSVGLAAAFARLDRRRHRRLRDQRPAAAPRVARCGRRAGPDAVRSAALARPRVNGRRHLRAGPDVGLR